MIEEILPAKVASSDAFEDLLDGPLFPEEEATITRAVAKRRNEFTTARACARTALAELGLPPAPILPGERGAPQWPPGVVGSMTHCDGYRAAAVAWADDIVTIGLDAEPNAPLPAGVLDAIALHEERTHLAALSATAPAVCWDRLLFSAKESVYKAWFPMTGTWLGFEDASITMNASITRDATEGTFTARLLVPGPTVDGTPMNTFTGRWIAQNGLVLTAIALPVG